jgi:hypothetical protein
MNIHISSSLLKKCNKVTLFVIEYILLPSMLHILNALLDSGSATVRAIVDSRLWGNNRSHCRP